MSRWKSQCCLLKAAVAHAQSLSAQPNGLRCQTSAKRAMAECAACFIVSNMSRGSKSAVMKFTFIFTTCRFQVLLFPNWQNEQDSHSGDCSTIHGWSLKTICHLWVMLLAQVCASRKMTQLADSGDFGVEETDKPCMQKNVIALCTF